MWAVQSRQMVSRSTVPSACCRVLSSICRVWWVYRVMAVIATVSSSVNVVLV